MASAEVIVDAVVAINGTVSRSYGVVSSVSTRPEGPQGADKLTAEGWAVLEPQQGATPNDYNGAIDNTIAAGLFLSVPQADGTRAIILVKVLATTALYNALHPGYNA